MKQTKLFDTKTQMGNLQSPTINTTPHIYVSKEDGGVYIPDVKMMLQYKDGGELKKSYSYTTNNVDPNTYCYVLEHSFISGITDYENIVTMYVNGDLASNGENTKLHDYSSIKSLLIGPKGEYIGSHMFDTNDYFYIINMQEGTDHTDITNNCFSSSQNLEFVNLAKPSEDNVLSMNVFQSSPKLKTVILCDSITQIKENCFASCESLKYVYLPKNIQKISENAFANCTELSNIYFNDTASKLKSQLQIKENAFSGCTKTSGIICTDRTVTFYEITKY